MEIPAQVLADLLAMQGFDGCSCQLLLWFRSASAGTYYRLRQSCGTGRTYFDLALRPDGTPLDLGLDIPPDLEEVTLSIQTT